MTVLVLPQAQQTKQWEGINQKLELMKKVPIVDYEDLNDYLDSINLCWH